MAYSIRVRRPLPPNYKTLHNGVGSHILMEAGISRKFHEIPDIAFNCYNFPLLSVLLVLDGKAGWSGWFKKSSSGRGDYP